MTTDHVKNGHWINSDMARALAFTVAVLLSQPSVAYDDNVNKPTAGAMVADIVVARPILLGWTIVSTALWVVALPFSAAGGNLDEATQAMVVDPARATFVRCLGCTGDIDKHSASSYQAR